MISNIAAVHLSASRLISAMYYSDRAGDTKDAAPLTCRRVAAISAGGYYDLLKAAHWATEVYIGGVEGAFKRVYGLCQHTGRVTWMSRASVPRNLAWAGTPDSDETMKLDNRPLT